MPQVRRRVRSDGGLAVPRAGGSTVRAACLAANAPSPAQGHRRLQRDAGASRYARQLGIKPELPARIVALSTYLQPSRLRACTATIRLLRKRFSMLAFVSFASVQMN